MKKFSKYLLLSVATISLSGCFVTPQAMKDIEHAERAKMDMQSLYQESVKLDRPLSLSEAISRGLLYNYDYKMGLMEEVLQNNQLTLANFNMLPRLAANAGYNWRDDYRATRSVSLLTRTESLEPSFSEERQVVNADLGFSWNLLDFGLSYYTAKQQADRVMAAVERRRRVMNNMVKEIQTAYWKAMSAQGLLPQVERLMVDVDDALIDSKRIEKERLQSPLKMLEYRKSLLQVMSQLKQLHGELSIAKSQLQSLTNLPPGTEFVLDGPRGQSLPRLPRNIEKLQYYSLVYRPELREEAYQGRIDEQNVKKEIIRMFPGLSILGSTNYDSNKYLSFQNWQELGLRATWNLVNLMQAPKAIETAEMQVELAEMRRLALSAAVMSQVSISYNQYQQAVEAFKTADELNTIETEVYRVTNSANAAQQSTRLDRIQKKAQSIAALLDRNNALANAYAAHANLLVSIGIDLIPSGESTNDLDDMISIIESSMERMQGSGLEDLLKDAEMQNLQKMDVEADEKEIAVKEVKAGRI